MDDTPATPAIVRPERFGLASRMILAALLADPDRVRYALELGSELGIARGTVSNVLNRFESSGWVTSRWENPEGAPATRPPRCYFRLTTDTAKRAGLADLVTQVGPPSGAATEGSSVDA